MNIHGDVPDGSCHSSLSFFEMKHTSMKGVCGFSSTSGLRRACVPDVPRLASLPSMKVCTPSFIRDLNTAFPLWFAAKMWWCTHSVLAT